jgi:hypothetical protein
MPAPIPGVEDFPLKVRLLFDLYMEQYPDPSAVELDMSNHPEIVNVGTQPVNLAQYDHLLGVS